MAEMNLWVMLDVDVESQKGNWNGSQMVESPDPTVQLGPDHLWVRIKDTDDIWTIKNWDFEKGPLPKRLRGLSAVDHVYDLNTKSWTIVYPQGSFITWNTVRDARQAMLDNSDWVIVKYTELNEPVPEEWLDYRQALRDFPAENSDLDPEVALVNLSYIFDPPTKVKRIERGLPLDPPKYDPITETFEQRDI
jgi:hypothetical protein